MLLHRTNLRASSIANQLVLTVVFTLSFATYLAPNVSEALLLAPLVLFAALVLLKVFSSDSLLTALTGFFETDGLSFVIFLSMLMLGSSFESAYQLSLQHALFIIICLVLARIYMTEISIKEVLESFYWSGIASMLIFLYLGFEMIVNSVTTLARLIPFGFQPNLLALQLSGYFCVMVWKLMTGSWQLKIISGVGGIACIIGLFLTSSRGAIVGIAVGCIFAFGLGIAMASKQRRKVMIRVGLLATTLSLILFIFVQDSAPVQDVYTALDQILSLSTPDRGLDSGMTGRVDMWREVLRVCKDGTWLFGHGVRSSDAAYTYPMIDNSYMVILYDLGVIPLVLITYRFVSILVRVAKNCFRVSDEGQKKLYLACCMFLAMLLVTCIVERSLFAIGNPFSLLAFLFFATPTRCLESDWTASPGYSVPSRAM